MMRLVLAFALLAGMAWGGHKSRPPEIVVTELAVHHEDGQITVTGKVQNSAGKTLEGVEIIFQFEDDAGKVITTQRTTLDEKKFEPGAISEINGVMKDAPLAARMRVLAQTGSGRDLRVGNDGPFPVDQ
jgi:uncharacterized protein (TIGR02588 family)